MQAPVFIQALLLTRPVVYPDKEIDFVIKDHFVIQDPFVIQNPFFIQEPFVTNDPFAFPDPDDSQNQFELLIQ